MIGCSWAWGQAGGVGQEFNSCKNYSVSKLAGAGTQTWRNYTHNKTRLIPKLHLQTSSMQFYASLLQKLNLLFVGSCLTIKGRNIKSLYF